MRFFRWQMMLIAMSLSVVSLLHAETFALKTNALGWATTSPNIGAEVALSRKSTVQVFGIINPWQFGEKRYRFWSVEPEYRYWFCESFNGHFIGIHALGGEYNLKNVKLPFNLVPSSENGRHVEGWYAGAGITYGYQWMLSKHWNLEASLGVGYAYSPNKLYGRCERCLEKNTKHYVGPTKLALSVLYIF